MQKYLKNIHRLVSIQIQATINFKIVTTMLVTIVLLVVVVTACQIPDKGAPRLKVIPQAEKFHVVGHRGAAGLAPDKVIAFGRSIGSLYAIELVHRLGMRAKLVISHETLKASITSISLSTTRKGTKASLQANMIPGTISMTIPRPTITPTTMFAITAFQ